MMQAMTSDSVLETLTAVLASDRFPGEARLHGNRLLDRLKSPVQVVVLGKPQAGKSRLIHMLLGQAVPAPASDLPAIEIVHGPRERMRVVLEDGRVEDWSADGPLPETAAMLRLELPQSVLTRLSLTEVTLDGQPEMMRAAADWAYDRADIVLWCTQGFDAIERALWSVAPDALKDHSFLVLAKADQLLMKGQLQDRLAQLSDIVAQEFHSLFPVATIQAVSARGTQEDVWAASGGRALHEAVLRLVDTGRRADADNALLFLNRYASGLALTVVPTPAAPVEAPVETPVEARTEARTEAPVDTEATDRTSAPADVQDRAEVLADAMAYLQDRADRLLAELDARPGDDHAHVLAHCLETATTLSDLLGEFSRDDSGLTGLQDDVQESADMLLLMQIERSEDAATDAVTLLLQLKKDMADRSIA